MATRAVTSTERSCRSMLAVALGLFLNLQAATPAWAWGRLGHRVISRLAEKQPEPESQGRDRGAARARRDAGRRLDLGRRAPAADCPRPPPGITSTSRSTNPVRRQVVGRRSQEGLRGRQDQRVQGDPEGQDQVGRGSPVRPAVPDPLRRGHAHADARRRQPRSRRERHPGPVLRSAARTCTASGTAA